MFFVMDQLPPFEAAEQSAAAAGLPPDALAPLRHLHEKIAASPVLTALTLECCSSIAAGRKENDCGKNFFSEAEIGRFRLLLILLCFPAARENFRKAGYSENDFLATWRDISHWALYYLKECGELRIDSAGVFGWFFLHVTAQLIQLGRLQFQLPDFYRKGDDLFPCIQAGDPVISMHIYGGEPLDMEACRDSFRRLRQWLPRYRGEYEYRAVISESWLFSPELEPLLPETGNIAQFRKLGKIFASAKPSDALWRLFGERKPESVAHPNALQQKVLEFYRKGGVLHYGYLVIPREELAKF